MSRRDGMVMDNAAMSRPFVSSVQESSRAVMIFMTLTVYPLLTLWTMFGLLVLPVVLPLWALVTGWSVERSMRHLIWLYGRGWLTIMFPFVCFEREGFTPEKFQAPKILVVNHLSFFDTYCMALLPVFDVNFAVRSWPFKIIFYGFIMRLAGYLDVERLSWREALVAGRRILSQPACQLFFPEGHRSRDGELQRFYSGAFRLAVETGTPLVPMCLSGTDRLFPPGRFWLSPARIRLRALDPLDPAAFPGEAGHVELRKAVKELMQRNLEEMRG